MFARCPPAAASCTLIPASSQRDPRGTSGPIGLATGATAPTAGSTSSPPGGEGGKPAAFGMGGSGRGANAQAGTVVCYRRILRRDYLGGEGGAAAAASWAAMPAAARRRLGSTSLRYDARNCFQGTADYISASMTFVVTDIAALRFTGLRRVCPVDCFHGAMRSLHRPERVHRLRAASCRVPVEAIFDETQLAETRSQDKTNEERRQAYR